MEGIGKRKSVPLLLHNLTKSIDVQRPTFSVVVTITAEAEISIQVPEII